MAYVSSIKLTLNLKTMKRIQKIIPEAIKACEKILLKNNAIDKEFNGYISSFGASVISAGLLPSIIFYSQKGDSNDRHKLIECLDYILKKQEIININLLERVKTLYDENVDNSFEIIRLTEKITDAAVALKLAIRTFPKSKKQ